MLPDVFWVILLIGAFTYLIYRLARRINGDDQRADARRRNPRGRVE